MSGVSVNRMIPESTFANRPAASDHRGQWRVTDVGIYGSTWYSDLVTWSCPVIDLLKPNKGCVVPSLAAANAATYSQTGTLITVNNGVAHNIPSDFNGQNVYLVIGSGLATTGQFGNFQLTGPNTFTCVSTVSQTTSGAVNSNTAETTIPDSMFTLPAGVLGAKGELFADLVFNGIVSGNSKVFRLKLGSDNLMSIGLTTTPKMFPAVRFNNRGDQAVNISTDWLSYTTNSASPAKYFTINTAVAQTGFVTVSSSAANEYNSLEKISVRIYPS
jgi:hypothetical protein